MKKGLALLPLALLIAVLVYRTQNQSTEHAALTGRQQRKRLESPRTHPKLGWRPPDAGAIARSQVASATGEPPRADRTDPSP
ncbi:MAG: hypothetical protein R3E96_14410 [Planctomycetota bacterium]